MFVPRCGSAAGALHISQRSACATCVLVCLLLVYLSYAFNACLMARIQRAFETTPAAINRIAVAGPPADTDGQRRPAAHRGGSGEPMKSPPPPAGVQTTQRPPTVLRLFGSVVRVIPLLPGGAANGSAAGAHLQHHHYHHHQRRPSTAAGARHHQPPRPIKRRPVVKVAQPAAATGEVASREAGEDGNEEAAAAPTPKYQLLQRRSQRRPARRLPHALIIGVKKSGTRALLEFIRLHPDVRAAGCEVHFFDRHYGKGLAWYRAHMPPTIAGQLTMEKTPSYFVTRDAAARVHRMNAAVRLLIVVRDPVTRAISDYAQAASKKRDMRRFEELAFPNGTASGVDTAWGPVRIGCYARHLERWLRHFPLSQLLLISGERLIADPAAEMRRVQDFLGLRRVIGERHFYFNTTKGFPCLFKSEERSSPHCLGKTKGRHHPRIEPAAVEALRAFYRPFNERFYAQTGERFGWP